MDRIKEERIFVGIMVIAFCIFVLTPMVSAGPIEDATQVTQEYVKAFNEGNAEALSALFARDAAYIGWASPFPTEGREAIRAAFAGFFKAYPIHYLMIRDDSRKAYGDTVALINNWTCMYGDGKNPVKTVFGRNASVSATVEGRRVILFQHASFFPSAGP